MDAFDADIVIFAAADDPRGEALLAAIQAAERSGVAGVGSVLLIPETLVESRAPRRHNGAERRRVAEILARLELHPVTRSVAEIATALRGKYRMKTADAIHLATAITSGANRFLTNNRTDFPMSITEIDVIYPT